MDIYQDLFVGRERNKELKEYFNLRKRFAGWFCQNVMFSASLCLPWPILVQTILTYDCIVDLYFPSQLRLHTDRRRVHPLRPAHREQVRAHFPHVQDYPEAQQLGASVFVFWGRYHLHAHGTSSCASGKSSRLLVHQPLARYETIISVRQSQMKLRTVNWRVNRTVSSMRRSVTHCCSHKCWSWTRFHKCIIVTRYMLLKYCFNGNYCVPFGILTLYCRAME